MNHRAFITVLLLSFAGVASACATRAATTHGRSARPIDPNACGGIAGRTCPEHMTCEIPPEHRRAFDAKGVCVARVDRTN